MHDLRRQALESGKTTSRKARSRQSTPGSSKQASPTGSRSGSRVASRNASDDEDAFSDGTQWSTNSLEDLASPGESDESTEQWTADLGDRISQICDRKRSSVQGREETLNAFIMDITRHYAREEIQSKMGEVLPNIVKSVKSGGTEREVVLALKAISLLLVTLPSDKLYDEVHAPLKTTITDAQHPAAKIAAIHALSIATFYGGATEEEVEETMEFFLEIVTSDGHFVDEPDNGEVVTAALEEWGFLATQLEDIEEMTEEAMDAFVDQLDSSNPIVQIAAGDNIALMYEKSYTEAESDDDEPEGSDDGDEADDANGTRMIKRYTVYRNQHQLEKQMQELARASSKRLSKKDRKALHLSFTDFLHTIEKPTRGPRYSTALDEDGRELGSRLKISIHGGGKMMIDTWWKLHRLNALKRLLQSGFLVHYEHNEVVFDSLPVIVEDG